MTGVDGLYAYEVVLLVAGTVLFAVLLTAFVFLVFRDKPYGKLLMFFGIPIVMMGFPAYMLAGTTVKVWGFPAPLFAVASGSGYQQINFQVPYAFVFRGSNPEILVEQNGTQGSVTPTPATSPGDFFRIPDGVRDLPARRGLFAGHKGQSCKAGRNAGDLPDWRAIIA